MWNIGIQRDKNLQISKIKAPSPESKKMKKINLQLERVQQTKKSALNYRELEVWGSEGDG